MTVHSKGQTELDSRSSTHRGESSMVSREILQPRNVRFGTIAVAAAILTGVMMFVTGVFDGTSTASPRSQASPSVAALTESAVAQRLASADLQRTLIAVGAVDAAAEIASAGSPTVAQRLASADLQQTLIAVGAVETAAEVASAGTPTVAELLASADLQQTLIAIGAVE